MKLRMIFGCKCCAVNGSQHNLELKEKVVEVLWLEQGRGEVVAEVR